MSSTESAFYEAAAKRFAASTAVYRVRSVVHLENMNDRWFWQDLLQRYRPGKYKFQGSSRSMSQRITSGCSQCLKYINFLSARFFVCIDSDYRYLMQEKNIKASLGVLQTYTYSWENHCAFAGTLQHIFEELCPKKAATFNFIAFLSMYSSAVYLPFLYLLNTMRLKRRGLNRTDFHAALSEHFEVEDEKDNGRAAVCRIQQRLNTLVHDLPAHFMNIDTEKVRYEAMGVKEDTAYLFVRGHCLYDYLCALGNHLCLGTGIDFENQILKRSLSGHYTEMDKIATDMKDLIR